MRRALCLALLVAAPLCAGPAMAQDGAQDTARDTGAAPAPQAAAPVPIAQLRTAAEAGDTAAQYALALRHHQGQGVTQDFATAARWLAQAANAGHAPAQNLLGRYYFEGLGGPRDPAMGRRLLGLAARAGDPGHIHDYARAIEAGDGTEDGAPPDPVGAAPVYEAAAGQGHVEAAVSLGVLLQEGRGVAQDLPRALALYEAAARAGSARAVNNLGLMYVRGQGVEQDYERAAALFTAAAEAGLAQAYTNLAVMYENGFGVPLDEARAAELYRAGGRAGGGAAGPGDAATLDPPPFRDDRIATPEDSDAARDAVRARAQAGDPVAGFRLALLLMETPEAGHAEWAGAARALAPLARLGHGASMANLGLLHLHGRGVAQDYVLGAMWLTRAQAAGVPGAEAVLAAWQPRMTAAQINSAQALAAGRDIAATGPATETAAEDR